MISIIIPVKREGPYLEEFLKKIPENEIIIVGKVDQVKGKYIKIKSYSSNRGHLMNLGAKKSTNEMLLFLHPDTYIDSEVYNEIKNLSNEYIGGGIEMKFFPSSFLLNINSYFANIRMKLFNSIYGVQCMFVRKKYFDYFKKLDLCEDIEFSQRLKKKGKLKYFKFCKTSSRRFKNGVIKQSILNQIVKLLFHLGVNTKTLRKMYGK